MKIQFTGHQKTERQVELTQEELASLFDALKAQFLNHVKYTSAFSENTRYCNTTENKVIQNLCEKYEVDAAYTPDRVAFISEILKQIVNVYDT